MKIQNIKWKIAGFQELRRAPGVEADIRARAGRVAATAGAGFEANVSSGRSRVRASVVTATDKAKRANAKSNRLLNSLDAGR